MEFGGSSVRSAATSDKSRRAVRGRGERVEIGEPRVGVVVRGGDQRRERVAETLAVRTDRLAGRAREAPR